MFQNLSDLEEFGFTGFKTVDQLLNDSSCIPPEKGIYVITNSDCYERQFLAKGVGGYFKKRDPNVPLLTLENKWVENCSVLYIGQAGGNSSSATLKRRVSKYLEFGKGKAIGHYGGRFIWQLANHRELVVAWKILNDIDPELEEKRLLKEFYKCYGKLPFANLRF